MLPFKQRTSSDDGNAELLPLAMCRKKGFPYDIASGIAENDIVILDFLRRAIRNCLVRDGDFFCDEVVDPLAELGFGVCLGDSGADF